MREFMTRVSDYLSERRDDPERKEDRLSLAVIIAAAIAVVVLLLLFWWGLSIHEKKELEAAEKAKELQAQQEEQELTAVTYEEKMKEYLSQNAENELREEYLANTNEMAEKIRELQSAMESVQKEVTKVVEEYHESTTVETREEKETKAALTTLQREVSAALENLSQTEKKLAELSSGLQTIDNSRLPQIEQQIGDVRTVVEQVRSDASGVRDKLAALETADQKLGERFSGVEQELNKTLTKNLNEIDARLDQVQKDIRTSEKEAAAALEKMEKEVNQRLEEKIAEKAETLSEETLSYRYDKRSNTLYLTPNQQSK